MANLTETFLLNTQTKFGLFYTYWLKLVEAGFWLGSSGEQNNYW